MKNKGFTLVELLAVIVILAIIALITIPAVMKMIDNATVNSYKRSIDLYGKAISTAIIEYQSDMLEKNRAINITFDNIEPYIEYEGNEVDCKIKQIYSDRTVFLTECYVNEELVYADKNVGYGDDNYYYYANSMKKIKLIKYIEAVEEAIQGKNINGTCNISEDKITCNGQDIGVRSKLENAIEGTLTIENDKVKKYNNLKFETEKKIIKQEAIPEIIDEENTSNSSNTQENIISQTTDYRGYYGDIDGDGEADGIIYADLAHDGNGEWGPYNNGQVANNGSYSYTAQTNLKEYTISKNKYKGDFGEKEIISVKKESSGNTRFYVMALEDFTTGEYTDLNDSNNSYPEHTAYYWYKNGFDSSTYTGRMSTWSTDTSEDFGTGYTNTGKIIEIWNKNGSGEGSYSGAIQDEGDVWGYIQEKYNSKEKWYIPSRGEWGAFADCFEIISNYNTTYGLSGIYWSSSQRDIEDAWCVYFQNGYVGISNVAGFGPVRLGATF